MAEVEVWTRSKHAAEEFRTVLMDEVRPLREPEVGMVPSNAGRKRSNWTQWPPPEDMASIFGRFPIILQLIMTLPG